MIRALCLWSALLLLSHPAHSSPMGAETELLRIRIVNDHGGEVAVSRDCGRSWNLVGRVVRYTSKVNPRGYTASKWVPPGRVAATAVNAIHINCGYNAAEDRGVVFSVLPREFLTAPQHYTSFLSPDSSIYTDIAAGESIFGGGDAPLVGNQVFLERGGRLVPLGEGYLPERGDALVIVVSRPARYPLSAEFENWPGGRIVLRYADGESRAVGWVVRPVEGIGRFLGAAFAATGRVRANHAGVVDISTSPIGELGAFQIIPVGHALSPEMAAAWTMTQWMIVGPRPDASEPWGSLSPLFYQHLRPDYRPDDLQRPDWRRRLLSRFLVEVDRGDGWEPMPALRLSPDPGAPLPGWASSALLGVVRLRILFPVE